MAQVVFVKPNLEAWNTTAKFRFRQLIESAPALIVHGHVQRDERSINVISESYLKLGRLRPWREVVCTTRLGLSWP